MYYSQGWAGAISEPGVKKVCWLAEPLSNVRHDFNSKFVHHIIVIIHEYLESLRSFNLGPGSILVKSVLSLFVTDFAKVQADLIELLVGGIIRYKGSKASVVVGILISEVILVEVQLDVIGEVEEPFLVF